jgi:uncharacterized protein YcbK (DUF882 family)
VNLERRDRRAFLAAASALVIASRVTRAAAAADVRRISFVHTHTSESLSLAYFEQGAYVPGALQKVAHFLRDFRTGDEHPIDPPLLDYLTDLRMIAGLDAPYEVISGYRSPHTNAELHRRSSGVSEHSLHMEGRAIDVRLEGFPTERLHELALKMRRGGVGFYPSSNFVHLDTGRIRSW